jgi:hypothetical protein
MLVKPMRRLRLSLIRDFRQRRKVVYEPVPELMPIPNRAAELEETVEGSTREKKCQLLLIFNCRMWRIQLRGAMVVNASKSFHISHQDMPVGTELSITLLFSRVELFFKA